MSNEPIEVWTNQFDEWIEGQFCGECFQKEEKAQFLKVWLASKRSMPVVFATQELIDAVELLKNNVRSERGVIASGIRDNASTRAALAVVLGYKFEQPVIELPSPRNIDFGTLNNINEIACFSLYEVNSAITAAGYQYRIKE